MRLVRRSGRREAIAAALAVEPPRDYEVIAADLSVSESYVRSLASRLGLRRQKPAERRRERGALERGILD